MNILALDGSSDVVQIVIHDAKVTLPLLSGGNKIFFFSEKEEYVAEKILFFLEKALKSANLSWKELDGIIMISGPGSFTSLRLCGMSVKILAYAGDIPLYAFSHFDAERLKWQNVYKNVAKNQQFLLVHAIHQQEFGYCLLNKKQFFAENDVLQPKTQRLENIEAWIKEIMSTVDESLPLMLLGQSARWLWEYLYEHFGENFTKKKIILPFSPQKNAERETFVDLNGLINFILQGELTKDRARHSLYRADAKSFEPNYVGGFWKTHSAV